MFERLKNFFRVDAATQLPPIAPPKVRPGSMAFPSYLKTTRQSDALLPLQDRSLASTDTVNLRSGADTRTIIANFCAASPDLSAAVWAYIRLGVPKKYTVVAKNPDGTFNPEATSLLQQLVARFDLLPDYAADGFTSPQSIRATSESLARELIMYGSCCGELVLGKDRLPRRVMPISTTQIKFIADLGAKNLKPVQIVSGQRVDLDFPTFIYVSIDQDTLQPYSASPLESAIKPAIYSEQFSSDITRIVARVIHPRQKVVINEEMVRKNLSPEAQMDANKAVAELNAIIASVEAKVNGLNPEDALVYLDSIGFEIENASNAGLASEYTVLQQMSQARLAAGSKTNGTILGYSAGSSNIASAETMLFLKSVEGAITAPLEDFWSRVFTLSARLFGYDVVTDFTYEPVDLRPENEILAFKQTKQMMVLEQLSLGIIDDDTACLQLTGGLPRAGAPKLSGTMFKQGPGLSNGGTMPGTGAPATAPSNDGSTLNQNLAPKTPAVGRGQNKKAETEVIESTEVEPAQPTFVTPNITMNIDNTQQTASILKMRRDEDGNLMIERVVNG